MPGCGRSLSPGLPPPILRPFAALQFFQLACYSLYASPAARRADAAHAGFAPRFAPLVTRLLSLRIRCRHDACWRADRLRRDLMIDPREVTAGPSRLRRIPPATQRHRSTHDGSSSKYRLRCDILHSPTSAVAASTRQMPRYCLML